MNIYLVCAYDKDEPYQIQVIASIHACLDKAEAIAKDYNEAAAYDNPDRTWQVKRKTLQN